MNSRLTGKTTPNDDQTVCVYALFDDRSAAKIMLSTFLQSPGSRPSLESPITDLAVRKSAERGFYAALSHYQKCGRSSYPGHQVVWEFSGNSQTYGNYTGSSAGLAFFIQFMVLLMQAQGRPRASFTVAATGELSDLTLQAQIQPIQSLPDKLQAAFAILKSGDKIFYPAANKDVPRPLLRTACRKGIEVRAIGTTQEMTAIISDWFDNEKPDLIFKVRKWIAGLGHIFFRLGVLIAMLLLAGGLYQLGRDRLDGHDLIHAIEQGEFADVPLAELRASRNPELTFLAQQTRTPVTVHGSFIYLADQRPTHHDAASLNRIQHVLLDRDAGYRLEVRVDPSCYFYLFQFESDDGVDLLFPLASFDLDYHHLGDHQVYFIPGNTDYFYFKSAGVRRLVTLFWIGTLWRAKDLETLCQEFDRATTDIKKREYRDQLLLHIQRRCQALQNGWKGLYVQQSCFWRQ